MNTQKFYINGQWVTPHGEGSLAVINPSTEEIIDTIRLGNHSDVNNAVQAAKNAFPKFSTTTVAERIEILESVIHQFSKRMDDMAEIISKEVGVAINLTKAAHVLAGIAHLKISLDTLKSFCFTETQGTTQIQKEPIGVCAMISPWNWPINQITSKVGGALATGCTMVVKPSEIAPLNTLLLAEIIHEAGVPEGVFNLINGTGQDIGNQLTAHPDVDMISFTGSTRAGVEVAKSAAPTIKRVSQELGGKSANIILDDAKLDCVVARDIEKLMMNTGQTCNAPSRMLIPRALLPQVELLAIDYVNRIRLGPALDTNTDMGPLVSSQQWRQVQGYIEQGMNSGARLLIGGTGKPDNLSRGYYVKPTIFSEVTSDMKIAQEEIFGPVLCIIPYDSEEEAIEIANDSIYGLAGYVSSENTDRAKAVANKIRAGVININGAGADLTAPFGGFKQSGNGREWGHHGFDEYLEIKSILGYH